MSDKELVESMVAAFEEYGDEYTIEQAMQHVADVCQKHFVERACAAIDSVDGISSVVKWDNLTPDTEYELTVIIDDDGNLITSEVEAQSE